MRIAGATPPLDGAVLEMDVMPSAKQGSVGCSGGMVTFTITEEGGLLVVSSVLARLQHGGLS